MDDIIPELTSEGSGKGGKANKFNRFRDYFKRRLATTLEQLQMLPKDKIIVYKSEKQAMSKNSKHPEKRSSYIGVSKNGANWQSLVVVNKTKLYIATSPDEEEAAKIFDFYTLLHSFGKGKLNWTYSVGEAIELISRYESKIDTHGNRGTSTSN